MPKPLRAFATPAGGVKFLMENRMLSFEVWINDKKEYTIGFENAEEFGVYLSCHPELQHDFASFEASGYAPSENEYPDEIKWGTKSIRIGDEVKIKIIDTENPDLPSRTAQNIGLIPETKHAMLCSNCGKTHLETKSLVRTERIALCNECVESIIDASKNENET